MLGSRVSQTPSRTQRVTPPRTQARPRNEIARPINTNLRPFMVLAVMFLCAAGLVARLAFWQVMEHGNLTAMAAAEHASLAVQPAPRGRIFDAQGRVLATNVMVGIVYARPSLVKSPMRTARLMAPVLHESAQHLYALLTRDAETVLLRTAPLNAQDSQKVRNLALPGIMLSLVIRRAYPAAPFAAHVLGFTLADKLRGQYGLEGYYDKILSGTTGLRSMVKDTAGNDIRVSSASPAPSHRGADLHLSIDRTIQGLVEDELAKAVSKHQAAGGTIIVMNPHTGFILGMASVPTYDPNHYWQPQYRTAYSNPSTQWTYEPGSTMKVLTMAAGLDSGAITPSSALYDTGSFVAAPGVVIHNWNGGGFGYETMTQVLQHSANVGASWVAQRMGVDRFYTYIKRFGLGEKTGIDLQGEEQGILPLPGEKRWSIVNLYTNSFGQGLSVTPLQLLRDVSAVANGGVMMRPQVVKRLVADGSIVDRHPVSAGRVVSAHTARTLTQMLVHSAIDGEASAALVKGYDIAAKTGTANIANGQGSYEKGTTNASVVGYAPAYTPRFAALVVINRPRDTIWGSEAAAPVLHDLFHELFMYYRIPPSPHALNK